MACVLTGVRLGWDSWITGGDEGKGGDASGKADKDHTHATPGEAGEAIGDISTAALSST